VNRRFLTDSGLVLMPEVLDLVVGCDERIFVTLYMKVKWVSFHGGYDFGYILRLLMGVQV